MDNKKLKLWSEKLLDTGKRNNLINFKDYGTSTAQVLVPNSHDVFNKIVGTKFEVFNPKFELTIDEIVESETTNTEEKKDYLSCQEYLDKFSSKLKKQNQLLTYSRTKNPVIAIKNIAKKINTAMEETGVPVGYMAFGFIHWKESENSEIVYRAPLLLIPISITNESATAPFCIEATEEDFVVNETFNYLLQAEYGTKLPEYTEEDTFETYLDKVKEIADKLRWEVSDECKIGIFTFLKINMFHDIKNNESRILENSNIKSILGELDAKLQSLKDGDGEFKGNPLIDLHNVVDADSSQIEAIEMAKMGQSYVLQGPPGTGKSQTITNIIAECLYDGKKVLFVSEKLAALNVVYDKLKKAGLEDFCLELHSYKASKKNVIDSICHSLRADKVKVNQQAYTEISEEEKNQKYLDNYAYELHKNRKGIDKSLYELFCAYSSCRQYEDIELPIHDIKEKDAAYLSRAVEVLEKYSRYTDTIGENYRQNPWYGYKNADSSYSENMLVKESMQSFIEKLDSFSKTAEKIKADFGFDCYTIELANNFIKLCKIINKYDVFTPRNFKKENFVEYLDKLDSLKDAANNVLENKNAIDSRFDSDIYDIDYVNINRKLIRQYEKPISRIFSKDYKDTINIVNLRSKRGKLTYDQILDLTEELNDYNKAREKLKNKEILLTGELPSSYRGIETNWFEFKEGYEQLNELYNNGITFDGLSHIPNNKFNESKKMLANFADELDAIFDVIKQKVDLLDSKFDKDLFDIQLCNFDTLKCKFNDCLNNFDKVDNWTRFYCVIKEANDLELLPFIDRTIERKISNNKIVGTYKKVYYHQWIDEVIKSSDVLFNFSRVSHDMAVDAFCKKDKNHFAISKSQIREKVSANKPSLDLASGGSALSILLREGEKKKRQKPIKKLLEETGELVQVVKPCFLMSPLSVSTYLDPDHIHFDVVVFDEASQIFPQDAVGAIYRGDQLIVVGDSKQMPPSNFFNSNVDDDNFNDDEAGDINDFESILDICSTSMPQKRLMWHYRSNYEQLIAFSNKNFYDNTLISFPSSKTDDKWVGVDYYHVDGYFDRVSKTNRVEAEKVVDLIFENARRFPERSLGVVAFSVSQQSLIDNLLNKRRLENPSYEEFFSNANAEPFFIKNLETVQGDERDTIIFSTAYAKDVQGRFLHNFGPLNRLGGERRLNVAVTRAKSNVQLVTSLHATDIDLTKTQAVGAKLLREYLDYAEHGNIALERALEVNPYEQFDSEFEIEVHDFLKSMGYSVDTQVGCSGFKIDLGLKYPNSSDYALAIECDGATYHSSKNARDRDRLRQEVLERMGWKFYRIWSTDWFRNNAVEKDKLLKAVSAAINEINHSKSSNDVTEDKDFTEIADDTATIFPIYVEADVYELSRRTRNFQLYIRSILEVETPIEENFLIKRILFKFNRERYTSAVSKEYISLMRGCSQNGIIRKNGFLYLAGQKEFVFRLNSETIKRNLNEICIEEYAAGMEVLINQNKTVDVEGLYRKICNLLGFTKLYDGMIMYLDDALVYLEKQGKVKRNGDTVTYND